MSSTPKPVYLLKQGDSLPAPFDSRGYLTAAESKPGTIDLSAYDRRKSGRRKVERFVLSCSGPAPDTGLYRVVVGYKGAPAMETLDVPGHYVLDYPRRAGELGNRDWRLEATVREHGWPTPLTVAVGDKLVGPDKPPRQILEPEDLTYVPSDDDDDDDDDYTTEDDYAEDPFLAWTQTYQIVVSVYPASPMRLSAESHDEGQRMAFKILTVDQAGVTRTWQASRGTTRLLFPLARARAQFPDARAPRRPGQVYGPYQDKETHSVHAFMIHPKGRGRWPSWTSEYLSGNPSGIWRPPMHYGGWAGLALVDGGIQHPRDKRPHEVRQNLAVADVDRLVEQLDLEGRQELAYLFRRVYNQTGEDTYCGPVTSRPGMV